ncbi:TonB-dependent receptor domain-containing protein [Hydrogenophaga sp. IBVHS1]|uniref:TonB-dependent receptor domain-containing protein n=1 Tax=unclassified Hydrogenophaga TaxID=2610897 RepID=UPI000A2E0BCD|nr:TonB-dependent receptor [Hydrogenophaga sp. IBVHS1]OSZ75701.1 TonB-dependent receptor [Hydrogenophaga sp. IBVHS1]
MKNRNLRAPLAVLSLAMLAASPSHAQTETVALLKETVVTATRVETRTDAVLSDVVVIESEVIEQSAGRSLSELLARNAGLQMSANGGLGKQSGLFIRGTETRHMLLLIDGVRYGSSTAGSAVLDNIPLSAIQRIEVLKGPASALYGSDAVGGVVQIFTKRGEKGFHPQAGVTLGSFGHRAATAGLSGGNDAITYNLSVGTLSEDGFSSTNPKVAFGNHNPDKDGFEQDSLAASLRWAIAPGWATDVQFTQADSVSRFDQGPGTFDVRSVATTRVAAWGLERKWSAGSRTRLSLSRSDDKSDSYSAPGAPAVFDTAQTQWTLQHDWNTSLGSLLVGAESIKEAVSGTQAYAVNSRTTDAAFVGLTGQAGRHLWQANLRRDDNSQFGGATTGFASYGFQLTPNWRSHVAYGTSFKMPSFNTLYYVSPFFNGNPTTQPERGKNSEAGLTYSQGLHEVKLTRFDNRVRGFITTQPVVVNVPRARMEGWSLAYTGAAGDWSWFTSLELLDARNQANRLKLQRRADEVLIASLDHRMGAWNWGASMQLVSDRFDNAANTQRLPGFGTVDLHARYALNKDWSLALRLNNVGDKFYETAYGYNQPGRAAYVTLNWAPKK